MAHSTIEIVNKALILLGADLITDLSEGSNESTYAYALWDGVRKAALRLHPWNFAIKEIELPAVYQGGDTNFKYQYLLPSDSLRLLKVFNDPNYKLKGRSIYTNNNKCVIRYIYDNQDVSSWDPSFVDYVSYRLASELAYPITKSASLMGVMTAQADKQLRDARAIDGSEDIEDPFGQYDSSFISVRY